MLNRNRTITACAGITFWKRRRVAQLLARDLAPPRFCRSADAALAAARAQGGAVAIWSSKSSPDAESKAAQAGIKLRRMEDGFIRSRGLGSDFLAPASIVLDSKANYFDPSRSSDLEDLLANTVFDAPLRARARRLINLLVQGGVSKYAVSATPPLLSAKPGQRIVLVPGQVADDLSVRLGGGSVRGNADLLARVRAANPDAFIIFRPHPDVEAGHRPGAIANPVAAGLADQVSREHGIAPLLSVVDEVHTLTSLAGFEAVLRGRRVETYGQPFYAGWGLTVDHAPLARRQRRLTIEELAAAALILYPHYIDPGTGLLCGPETLIASFANQTLWRPGKLMQMRRWQGRLRYLLSMIIVRSAPARDSSPRPREDQIRS